MTVLSGSGTIKAEQMCVGLTSLGTGWNRNPRAVVTYLRTVLSVDLLERTSLCAGNPLRKSLTLLDLRETFWSIVRSPFDPSKIRDEAVEVHHAFMLLRMPPGPRGEANDRVQRLGKYCAFCWRTEVRWRPRTGACHIHTVIPLVESEACVKERKRARQAVRYARSILRCAPAELLLENGQPKYQREDVPPPTRETWSAWLREWYPLTVEFLMLHHDEAVLVEPLLTIAALEGRRLTEAERALYSDRHAWEVPVARCEAWRRIEKWRGPIQKRRRSVA